MKILISESNHFSPRALSILRDLGEVEARDLDRQALIDSAGTCEVLWVRLRNQIDRDVLDAAKALRVLVTPTTGLSHIDVAEAESRGVEILSLRSEREFLKNIHATAEHTVALTLALLRQIRPAASHAVEGGWNRDLFRGTEIYGKNIGIIGYGRLGRMVAASFRAFGAKILAADPELKAVGMDAGVVQADFNEVLESCDILSLHVPLDETTENLLDGAAFNRMKHGAFLVNTSRGELLDEEALLSSLQCGRLAGAALDVLRDEHAVEIGHNPLILYARKHDNLLITPHIGGATIESMAATELFMARKLATRYLS